ncbi:MAG: hypothetical protein KF763_11175 [Cyclobacteriaceae bacterium]|nr:hypothetical protein [Cyclobacteriaceae bacterium]
MLSTSGMDKAKIKSETQVINAFGNCLKQKEALAPGISFLPALLLVVLFYSCNQTTDSCLTSIPSVSTPETLAYGTPVTASGNQVQTCLLTLFDSIELKSPVDFDKSYNELIQFHQSSAKILLNELMSANESQIYCVQLGSVGSAQVYLLQLITGNVLEEEEYDIIFTLDDDNRVVDHLVIGASGVLYQRNFRFSDLNRFTITEVTGREETVGPSYAAGYYINKAGKIELENGEVKPAPSIESEQEFSESLIYLDVNVASVESFTALAFTDEILPDTVFSTTLFNRNVIIALSGVEDHEQILYVAWPIEQSMDKGHYRLTALQFKSYQTFDLLDQRLLTTSLRKKDDYYMLKFEFEQRWLLPGGNPVTGSPSVQIQHSDLLFKVYENGTLQKTENKD